MTVGVAVRCKDGVVLGTDSLATFSRGVPVARYTNKVYVINHKELHHPVGLIGAGMTAFIDKFVDRAKREGITVASKERKRKLDIVDFSESVCETIVSATINLTRHAGAGSVGLWSGSSGPRQPLLPKRSGRSLGEKL